MMNEEQLLRLKRDIDQAKTKVAELKGQQKLLMQQLKDNWQCESIEEAQKKLAKLEKEAAKISNAIDEASTEIEQKYILMKDTQ